MEPKKKSTRTSKELDSCGRLSDYPLIVPDSVKPSDPRLKVIGVFNPTFLRVNEKRLLIVRVDERPIQEEHQKDVANHEFKKFKVARVCAEESNQIRLFSISVPASFEPDFEPFLPESLQKSRNDPDVLLSYISHLRLAMQSGVTLKVADHPLIFPDREMNIFGCEDPRAAVVDGEYLICYTGISQYGAASFLAKLDDELNLVENRVLLGPDNKHVVLFPEEIGRAYAMLCRPLTRIYVKENGIWMLRSPDMIHWGEPEPILFPRPGYWDSLRIGPSTTPLRTHMGWLLFYYGVDKEASYHIGAALLEVNDPSRVLGRTNEPLLSPCLDWERKGRRADTVFACGLEQSKESPNVRLYYGAGDRCIGAADVDISALLNSLLKEGVALR